MIHLNEFDRNRDGFYQCHSYNDSTNFRSVFIFSNGNLFDFEYFVYFEIIGARSIDRHWTKLTEFHDNLITTCRPIYFNYGFNEQFIELIDSKQTVRYNRSALLVKHIRSTTHLFCKLYIDTTSVGVRVQTLIKKNFGDPLLSDKYLKDNNYFEMNTNERDVYRIAFEDDSIYLHCPSTTMLPIQWYFLSYNYYLMKNLPTIYDTDTKINSVEITDAGMYICQTENTIHRRIILTILHPPKSPDNIYVQTIHVNLDSKYLLCCHLDGIPYPTYSWSMNTEFQKTSFVWCSKRCCWLHVIYKKYENIICTSANKFGMAKYNIHLIVQDIGLKSTVFYDEPHIYNYNHTDNFNLIRKIEENPTIKPMVITTNMETHSSEIKKNDKIDDEKLIPN
ncbi:unnamed protein product [Adineta steineri]|uniref:Ig-like domain-containing protein n=1 Tax=Adineta steineri TaxID=433720 RepID=A0A814JKH6_9BILA|nr:unnamed protein product [Adineta steineri]